MILNDIVIQNIISKRIISSSLERRVNRKDFFFVFLKDSICETIWRIRRVYKRIYRIVSHKTSICRILDSYVSLDEELLLKSGEERGGMWNIEENRKLEGLVWNIYIELCLSVSVYSEWKDLLYRAGSLDSFEEIKFIDTVITSIVLKKKIQSNCKKDMCSKQCLCLRYSVMSIFFIQKEKKSIMQKCLTKVEYYQNRKMFEEIWDALADGIGTRNDKKNWVMLGFQGDDPSTDFRSMGIFGLQLLHHFVLIQNEYSKIMISESRSNNSDISLPWYSFALAAINILAYIIDLMNENRLERIFIQCYSYGVYLEEIIKHLFCYAFISFHHFWRYQVSTKNVKTVFDFERCLKRFKKETRNDLTIGNNMFKF